MSLMNMSIAGAVMILVVILIRALLIDKLPKRTFIILWMIVIARLLIPVEIASKTSVYNLRPELMTSSAEIMEVEEVPTVVEETEVNYEVPVVEGRSLTNQIESVQIEEPVESFKLNRNHIWLIGSVLLSIYFVRTYSKSKKILNTSIPCDDERIINYVKSNSDRNIDIRWLDRINTAITYGIFKPIIVSPKRLEYADDETIEKILLHEHYHIESYDSIKKLLMMVTLIVHWFNPLVWIMYTIFNRDMELYCDERVLIHLGRDERADYAYTLIEQADRDNRFSLSSGFSKNALEERVRSVMKYKKSTVITIGLAVVVLIGVVVFFATSKKDEDINNAKFNDVGSHPGINDGEFNLWVMHEKIEKTPIYYLRTDSEQDLDFYYSFEDSKDTIVTFENSKGQVEEIANSEIESGEDTLKLTKGMNVIYIESDNNVGVFSSSGRVSKPHDLTYSNHDSPIVDRERQLRNFDKSEYKNRGLKLNEEDMTLEFQGKRVKRFYDLLSKDITGKTSYRTKEVDYTDSGGEVYLATLRDIKIEDSKIVRKFKGFMTATDEESFNDMKYDLVWNDNGGVSDEEYKYLIYESYGVKYNEEERKLYYNGKKVKEFYDLQLIENEYFEDIPYANAVSYRDPGGEVLLCVNRDLNTIKSEGINKFKNIEVIESEEDYYKKLEKLSNDGKRVTQYDLYENYIQEEYKDVIDDLDFSIESIKLTDKRDEKNASKPRYVIELNYKYKEDQSISKISCHARQTAFLVEENLDYYTFMEGTEPIVKDGMVYELEYLETDSLMGDLNLFFSIYNGDSTHGSFEMKVPLEIENKVE